VVNADEKWTENDLAACHAKSREISSNRDFDCRGQEANEVFSLAT